jgi:hypothetical protein
MSTPTASASAQRFHYWKRPQGCRWEMWRCSGAGSPRRMMLVTPHRRIRRVALRRQGRGHGTKRDKQHQANPSKQPLFPSPQKRSAALRRKVFAVCHVGDATKPHSTVLVCLHPFKREYSAAQARTWLASAACWARLGRHTEKGGQARIGRKRS